MTHLLVTNDFPPKVGGIQTYLWELWRRLPPADFAVLTTPHPAARVWDAAQPFRIHRVSDQVLLPTPGLARRIRTVAAQVGATLVVVDPALPIGKIGPSLGLPYAVVLHGAEITVPGRLPGLRRQLSRVLCGASGIVAAGGYPAAEAMNAAGSTPLPEIVEIPPGVDLERFRPLSPAAASEARTRLGLAPDGLLVVSASRLVPRKGMDTLIEALTHLVAHRPDLRLAIAGSGRDHGRLDTLVGRSGISSRVRLMGRVPDEDLAALYGSADVFVMLCRNRWGGLEQEGFGIVFLEAAACGVPQVAGDSGGAAEAVIDGVTGVVVRDPSDAAEAANAIARLLDDPALRATMGVESRRRAETEFSWDHLSATLGGALARWEP
ncbi:MAG: glycosyltransferase family 4 protein [Acidimicrobiales bacterium]